jgi:hypothetical protein
LKTSQSPPPPQFLFPFSFVCAKTTNQISRQYLGSTRGYHYQSPCIQNGLTTREESRKMRRNRNSNYSSTVWRGFIHLNYSEISAQTVSLQWQDKKNTFVSTLWKQKRSGNFIPFKSFIYNRLNISITTVLFYRH